MSRRLEAPEHGGRGGQWSVCCKTELAAIGGGLKNAVGLRWMGSPMMIVMMLVGRLLMSFCFVRVEEMMDPVWCRID